MSTVETYPIVMGEMHQLRPQCQKCIWLRKVLTNTMGDYYACGAFPFMYPETCCSKIVEKIKNGE